MTPASDAAVALLPCASCSSDAGVIRDGHVFAGQDYGSRYPEGVRTQRHGWQVRCHGCGLQTCWWHYEDEATAAWNRRTPALDAAARTGVDGVEAVARAMYATPLFVHDANANDDESAWAWGNLLSDESKDYYRRMARAAIAAATDGGEG